MNSLQHFEIPKIVQFQENEFGLVKIIISNELADAEIYLYGGNLTHFQPKDEKPVIFDGRKTEMDPVKTLHAGIPVCWPWFGPHPTDSSKPQHGFARNRVWEVRETVQLLTGETKVVLGLNEDEETLKLFAYPFDLALTFTIGKQLNIELRTYNSGTLPIHFTQALHNYFLISDIDDVVVNGVERVPFIDLTDEEKEKQESAPLLINRVINRVYYPINGRCEVVDDGAKRKINIDREGSNSTTIWNPGNHNGIHDLQGDKYRKFVCIETTNARRDSITLKPGEFHRMIQEISLSENSSK
ncbi:MAG: D-hexose-6-phosphate mutarotase [Campylobacterota bacterium]|nr:D-hexose-6-phosphate mutarotase [Campylobacterota bacterium]